MKNLLLFIVFISFTSFTYSQATFTINNATDASGFCSGTDFFASFNSTGICPPTFNGVQCFDVPVGITSHNAIDESCSTFPNINDVRGITLQVYGLPTFYYISFCDALGNLQINGSGSIATNNCFGVPTTVIWNITGNSIFIYIY